MTNHQWDDKYLEVAKHNPENKNRQRTNNHQEEKKEDKPTSGISMAQQGTTSDRSKLTCYICGEKGHYCTECPKINKIPKNK